MNPSDDAPSSPRPASQFSSQTEPEPGFLRISLPPVSHFLFEDISDSQTTTTPIGSLAEALNSTLPIYLPQLRGPLRDPEQARLLTVYTEHLSGWLALNDPRHHFSASVPQLAMKCPMLLDAIFAFSARYLSRSDQNISALMADEYHYSCVCRLIAALKDIACASESALALSTVILRMHEMLSDRNAEVDLQRHLRGSLSLFSHNANKFGPGSLKHTAFWTYVRQEILTALRGCSPTNIDTSDKTYYVVFDGDTDDDWTNNIIWLTARVINHYFDSSVSTTASVHQEMLVTLVNNWQERLPDTFNPLSAVIDDHPFPAITYTCIWHNVAMQFFHLCKVIFITSNRSGEANPESVDTADAVKHIIQICGIVRGLFSYKECRYPGALVNAAEILAYCGRTLRGNKSQSYLLDLLHRIEAETTWDVTETVEKLKETWSGVPR
ncbi:transcriptional regulator family: Fungal Specific TF [Trichoderma aggressivum f. europaeum]|uniref:Transcriptional regulator family: Fungal Specific TF n=1 Tax=Trichoderma aggressivum f. europaeum TaxID=173218 RepID=A0AAE1LYK2_9HYPO|nr:transcriptional regulator family: Fungal Specific TF [Trichoderma aggressivum f. europaeum]